MKMPQKIKDPFILLPFLLGVSLFIISSCGSAVDPVVIPTLTGVFDIDSCPADRTVAVSGSGTTAAVTWTAATATDSNGATIAAANIVSDVASGDDFPLGPTIVTYTFTDDANNTDTCSFTVTVEAAPDAPTIVDCPSDQTGTLAAIVDTTVAVSWTAPTATDSNGVTIDPASIVSSPASGSTFTLGDTVVTTTVTDTATIPLSNVCTFTVTIAAALTAAGITIIACPSDQTVSLADPMDTTAFASWTEQPTATDSNGVDIDAASIVSDVASGSDFAIGDTVVTTTVTDTANNKKTCTFTVTVEAAPDAPTIVDCPSDQTGTLAAIVDTTVAVTWTEPTATDRDGTLIPDSGIEITDAGGTTVTSGDPFPLGDTVVTYTFTDGFTPPLLNRCSFTVTVTAPALTQAGITITDCPSDQTVTLLDGATEVAVSWTAPTATDSNDVGIAATSIVSSPALGSDFSKGTTVVTTTVTDTAGNTKTCSFTVTVTAAALTQAGITITDCPSNISQPLAAFGDTEVAVSWTAPTATDSNGATIAAASIVSSPTSGSDFTMGPTTVTTTVTDTANNKKTCTFTVTIAAALTKAGLTIMCPSDQTVTLAAGATEVAVSWTAAIAFDSNGATIDAASIVSTRTSGSDFTLGDTFVITTVTDTAGNEKGCVFMVTVTDV